MRELTTRRERVIDAPAADVWAYRLDFLHLPEYNADVSNMERIDAGDGAGPPTYRFELASGARTTTVELRVTEAVPGELVAIEMGGALPARERFTVTGVPSDGAGPRCRAAIDLTLLVPDSIPAAHDEALLAHGTTQIAGELDRMQENLGTETGPSPVDEGRA
jgi:uncharacterized protein YndB with AHSA1/START domain